MLKANVSVLILTKNEEQDLPGCLASVSWADDIHVYDSHSTDSTVAIALAFGATITQRPFDNWAAHQNWGLRNVPFRHDWVLYIDADERVTPELALEIQSAVSSNPSASAFQIQRKDYFMNTWLRHVQATAFYVRLFRPAKIRYTRLVNPVTEVDGPTARLSACIDHYPFSKGISHWVNRHNSYSTLEAQQIMQNRGAGVADLSLRGMFSRNLSTRRYNQKELFYRLPARPLIKFFVLYFLKLGLLDGRAGFTYSALQAFYEFLIVLKTNELQLAKRLSSAGD